MLTILAIDPGTTFGWACSDGTSGVERLDGRSLGRRLEILPAPERHAIIADRLTQWLDAMVTRKQPAVLVVERQLSHHHAHLLLGLRMVALLVGWRRRLLVEEVNPGAWKPWARANIAWAKGDQEDARALLAYWTAERLPELQEESEP